MKLIFIVHKYLYTNYIYTAYFNHKHFLFDIILREENTLDFDLDNVDNFDTFDSDLEETNSADL